MSYAYQLDHIPLDVTLLEDRIQQQEAIIANLRSQRDKQIEAMRVKIVALHKQLGIEQQQRIKAESRLSTCRFELHNLRAWTKTQAERITTLRRMLKG